MSFYSHKIGVTSLTTSRRVVQKPAQQMLQLCVKTMDPERDRYLHILDDAQPVGDRHERQNSWWRRLLSAALLQDSETETFTQRI